MNPKSKHTEVSPQQLRQFGWLMGGVFGVIGVWPLIFRGEGTRLWALIIALIFGVLGSILPRVIQPVYRGWMIFGEKIGWVNSRILLGLLYYVMVTPTSWGLRLLGKRPLQLEFDPKVESYRVPKEARAVDHVLKSF